jgi:hypothetical protein
VQPDDLYWRGQDEVGAPAASGQWLGPEHVGPEYVGAQYVEAQYVGAQYVGPPPTAAPPSAWRPEHIVEPAAPRRLPAQDHAVIDADEARARTLTYGIGIVTGAVLLILLCALCGRALF